MAGTSIDAGDAQGGLSDPPRADPREHDLPRGMRYAGYSKIPSASKSVCSPTMSLQGLLAHLPTGTLPSTLLSGRRLYAQASALAGSQTATTGAGYGCGASQARRGRAQTTTCKESPKAGHKLTIVASNCICPHCVVTHFSLFKNIFWGDMRSARLLPNAPVFNASAGSLLWFSLPLCRDSRAGSGAQVPVAA
jgi:hypothetical protein